VVGGFWGYFVINISRGRHRTGDREGPVHDNTSRRQTPCCGKVFSVLGFCQQTRRGCFILSSQGGENKGLLGSFLKEDND